MPDVIRQSRVVFVQDDEVAAAQPSNMVGVALSRQRNCIANCDFVRLASLLDRAERPMRAPTKTVHGRHERTRPIPQSSNDRW